MASHNLTDDNTFVFSKLKEISENTVCFDCNAKNPTWASVTHGIFLCIDCATSRIIPEASTRVSFSDAVKEELPPEHVATSATPSTKASSTVTFKKPTSSAIRAGKTGRLGALKLTTKPQGDFYDQKPDKFVPASSSTDNGRSKSSPGSSSASQVECTDHLLSEGQTGAGTQVPSHGAPPMPSSSSSSSNVQVKKESEAGSKLKERLVKAVLGVDVYGLRRETDMLREMLHAEDADTIPFGIRAGKVADALSKIGQVGCEMFLVPIYGPMLTSIYNDLRELMDELKLSIGISIE